MCFLPYVESIEGEKSNKSKRERHRTAQDVQRERERPEGRRVSKSRSGCHIQSTLHTCGNAIIILKSYLEELLMNNSSQDLNFKYEKECQPLENSRDNIIQV